VTTRDRILDTALKLFNDAGTATVSTNHIAAAAGISPGNLYYHFGNKEEIIRGLFERLFDMWDRVFALQADRAPSVDDIGRLARVNFDVLWDYRFAYRELSAILRRDEVLRERWLNVRQRGYTGFHALITAFATAGVVVPRVEQAEIDRLADLCWLISEFWLPNLEVSGQPVDPTQLDRGVALMLQVLTPIVEAVQQLKDTLL
jgi:AcrR family transcriptional regulator